jgi:putative aminopeptidase FrvX
MQRVPYSEFLALAEPLMRLPTAPFHEHAVAAFARSFAAARPGIRLRADRYGNLLLTSAARDEDSGCPRMVVTAHMDHPGVAWSSNEAPGLSHFHLLGGTRIELTPGAALCVFGPGDSPALIGMGTVERACTEHPACLRVALPPVHQEQLGSGAFGMWSVPTWRRRGTRLHSRACDDLGGVAVALAFLDQLVRRSSSARAGVLLTRAEEVGFAGMLGAISSGLLNRADLFINTECSSTRAGARLGHGPVVRVGDRMWTFDPYTTASLVNAAEELTRAAPDFRYQRKLMDSGSCEATALMSAGFTTAAVALPLGNYHNAGQGRLAPEIIDLGDATALVDLLLQVACAEGGLLGSLDRARTQMAKNLRRQLARHEERLLATAMGAAAPT